MGKEFFPGEWGLGHESLARRERRPASLRFELQAGSERHEAVLVDLSHEGCGVQVPAPLTPGQPVTLHVEGQAIAAEVRWYADGSAGLVFPKPAARDAAVEQRSPDQRVPSNIAATVRRLGMPSYTVNVTDLSTHGCKVDVVERPRVGERVMLKFGALDAIDAQVCWVEGYCAGLRFERPIHAAVFELLLQRLNRTG